MNFLNKFAEQMKEAQGIQQELSESVSKAARIVEEVMRHVLDVARDTKDGDFANNLQNEFKRLKKVQTDLLMVAGNLKGLREKPEQ